MKDASPAVTYLKDYLPPAYLVDNVDLQFDLGEDSTLVTANMRLRINPNRKDHQPLQLDGKELQLVSIELDGRLLTAEDFVVADESLTIVSVPAQFTLLIRTKIFPQHNTTLEGLYQSNGMYCTQCEAEGFRRITYFLDRPDVMARYTTTIIANKQNYPVLLSNGNLVDQGLLDGDRHWAKWEDPFPKPCYLFALVAGDLRYQEDRFTTMSGREVTLRLFVEPHDIDKCDHALESLKKSMRWDEEVYGREYDLDIFMIVAVSHFNMGAMENKGLNIFNAACVLAKPETATDDDYENIEGIVAHEYFHNWSGNRVTCRDWFQLSLKEGFTVFRDQEFSADMGSRAVKRIAEVNLLRTRQFAEDAGPMAHSVRPESYMDISNFYTVTIYNKGAEVVRMLHTLLGVDAFRQGTDLYFSRHDGHAVTTDDFVRAMEDANGVDLSQFRRWYEQAGTPRLIVRDEYDQKTKRYRLNVTQACPPTPSQTTKKPFHLPLSVGLLSKNGKDIPLSLANGETTAVLQVVDEHSEFIFEDVSEKPLPSIARAFSAPVIVEYSYSKDDLLFLMAHDSDPFNRWDAAQRLGFLVVKDLLAKKEQGAVDINLDNKVVESYRRLLIDNNIDFSFLSLAINLPNESYLAEQIENVDPVALHEVKLFVERALSQHLEQELLARYQQCVSNESYRFDAENVGRRRLRNRCLYGLTKLGKTEYLELAYKQYRASENMTDSLGALTALADHECDLTENALTHFYSRWQHDSLVVDKWFAIQARSDRSSLLETIESLTEHPAYDIKNPNKVRAVIGSLAFSNPAHFHHRSGRGYRVVADSVLRLNKINPQMSARLVTALSSWKKLAPVCQENMYRELVRIREAGELSKDVLEVVTKSLID